jgi:hypothetical protein
MWRVVCALTSSIRNLEGCVTVNKLCASVVVTKVATTMSPAACRGPGPPATGNDSHGIPTSSCQFADSNPSESFLSYAPTFFSISATFALPVPVDVTWER